MMPSEFAHWPDQFLRGSNLEALQKKKKHHKLVHERLQSMEGREIIGKLSFRSLNNSVQYIASFYPSSSKIHWRFGWLWWFSSSISAAYRNHPFCTMCLLYWVTNFNNQRNVPNHWSGIHGCTKLEILPIHDPVSDSFHAFQPATARTSGEQCSKILFPSRCIGDLSQNWQAELSICESICWLVQSSLIPGS